MIQSAIASVEADVRTLAERISLARKGHPDLPLMRAALQERNELLHQLLTDIRPIVWAPPAR